MPSVPLSMHQLEAIAEAVARDLLEEWAINDRFTIEQLEEAKQNAVNDAIFVINNFMEHFNTYMMMESEKKKA
jgi:ribosomal protein S13